MTSISVIELHLQLQAEFATFWWDAYAESVFVLPWVQSTWL